ncbi:helix-turn-helix transcriptional regulator [Segeticoccus rhizosphaerae]|uniref:helix-turn-helix transcriptional regulator n=2 Tax=Segeticoccus rhizosphaerae TaxID=1104777 RepID=UPI0035A126D1
MFIEEMEASTRQRVLRVVSEEGPITAAGLAEHLQLTPAAVRRHLDALVEDGTLDEREPATAGLRRRGRPARGYVLSESGHRTLRNTYDGVATAALRFLEQQAGEDAVSAFARQRIAELEARCAAELEAADDDVASRTDALVRALTAEGYAASARPVGQGGPLAGVQLCQGHCPMQHVAAQFPQFCEAETEAFSRMLGVHVQRLATLAGGEHVCTTFIPTPSTPERTARPSQHTSDERFSR